MRKTLLRDVTLNPVMGEYLSMKESAKSDPVLQTQPDENYAREVMQLFSIGTVMLNLDGSVQLDGDGKPIPTYNEDTVKGFAKALSGWTYAGQDQTKPWRWLYPDIWDADDVDPDAEGLPRMDRADGAVDWRPTGPPTTRAPSPAPRTTPAPSNCWSTPARRTARCPPNQSRA